jgi:hypothetical protein
LRSARKPTVPASRGLVADAETLSPIEFDVQEQASILASHILQLQSHRLALVEVKSCIMDCQTDRGTHEIDPGLGNTQGDECVF